MRSKPNRKKSKGPTRLTLKSARREVAKKHPGLTRDMQDRIARRKITLNELAIHTEQYRKA